jgi:hypothetical protein
MGVAPQNIDIYAVAYPDGALNSELNPAPVNGVAAFLMTGLGRGEVLPVGAVEICGIRGFTLHS